MKLENKIIVVTGAGSGIGRALVAKFIAEKAKQVVAVDINIENAQQTATDYGCVAMQADVANEQDIIRIIEETESQIGEIDLFCSNAGLGTGESEQSPNDEWGVELECECDVTSLCRSAYGTAHDKARRWLFT